MLTRMNTNDERMNTNVTIEGNDNQAMTWLSARLANPSRLPFSQNGGE
jgi:hypothetical protein